MAANRFGKQQAMAMWPRSVPIQSIIAPLQIDGNITYNGKHFNEFVPRRTAAYVDQTDIHLGELTVRETFDFSSRCQGVGHKAGEQQ